MSTPSNPPVKRSAFGLLREVGLTLFYYVRGQLLVSLILTGLYAVAFGIFGVPLWPLVAVVCGFMNLVPVLGNFVVLLLVVGLSWAGGASLMRTGILAGICVIIFTLESYIVTPQVLGKNVGLRPLYVFLVLLIGGLFLGIPGLLIAVPLAAALNTALRYWQGKPGSQDTRP